MSLSAWLRYDRPLRGLVIIPWVRAPLSRDCGRGAGGEGQRAAKTTDLSVT